MSRRRNSKNLRRRVWERDRGICWICEEPVPVEVVTLDHVVPKSKGGRESFDNLRAAHEICNRKRGDHPERTGKRNPLLPPDVRARRRTEKNRHKRKKRRLEEQHRAVVERLASELSDRPASVTSTSGEIVWIEKDG